MTQEDVAGKGRGMQEQIIQERDFHVSSQRVCPKCGEDCWRQALLTLVYFFSPCSCPKVDYPHLVEQIAHRACFGGFEDGE